MEDTPFFRELQHVGGIPLAKSQLQHHLISSDPHLSTVSIRSRTNEGMEIMLPRTKSSLLNAVQHHMGKWNVVHQTDCSDKVT